jgi:hypothetical protein
MRRRNALIAWLAIPGLALAAPMDPKAPEEDYLRMQFDHNQARALETLRIREAKRKEFLDRSRIAGGADSCLAYAIATGDCAIPAAGFDRDLASHVPDSLEFLSGESLAREASRARRSAFEQSLDRAFLDAYRPEDSGDAAIDRARNPAAETGGAAGGYDAPTLLKAFPRIRAQVVAASDSAWLAARLADPRGGILPATLPARELPDSAFAFLARLPRGQWTPILRVPFGFLACSWLDPLPAAGTFAEIRSRAERSAAKSGRRIRPQAIDSLRRHGEGCKEEDTLALSLRLVPALRTQARDSGPGPGPAWLAANSTVLPAAVKGWLWMKARRAGSDTLGPMRSVYGSWMLAPSTPEIRPGRRLDSNACLARAEARLGREYDADLIRREWETLASKADADVDRSGAARAALLERLSAREGRPESAYQALRERWVSRSLRFTRDLGFLEEPEKSPQKLDVESGSDGD